jgi:hypothetical protein
MKNENEFEFEGNTYIAVVDEFDADGCVKCALDFKSCGQAPDCLSETRVDGSPVHFEKKQ